MSVTERCTALLVTAIIVGVTFTATIPFDCRQNILVASEVEEYITSPNYPNVYDNFRSCFMNIRASSSSDVVVLRVLYLMLDASPPLCIHTYLQAYSGSVVNIYGKDSIQRWCGYVQQGTQIESNGPNMFLSFYSWTDNKPKNGGFKLGYTSRHKSGPCTNVSLTANGTMQLITSLGYPNYYENNADCQWIISADSPSSVVVLKLLDFQLENSTSCSKDNLQIYDGESKIDPSLGILCGQTSTTQLVSSGHFMTVVFHTDASNNYKGFQLKYTSQEKSALCSNVNLLATEKVNHITSPNYPNNYPSNLDCHWRISADSPSRVVVLRLTDFALAGSQSACIYDYVSIYEGYSKNSHRIQLLCGQVSSIQFISNGTVLTVVFHSDGTGSNRGFNLQYISQEKSALCSNVNLRATATEQFITSPEYPGNYPSNTTCQWTIAGEAFSEVVVLKVLDFELERPTPAYISDYVIIYDGNSTSSPIAQILGCRASSQQVISTGHSLTVVFHSNEINNFRGFKLEYSSHESASCVNVNLPATRTHQYIISPGYPKNYPSNMGCQWKISADSPVRVVVLEVLDFELEGSAPACPFDYVTIYNGPSASSPRIQLLCGHQESATQFTSTGPHLTVVFRSDGAINFKGFKLGYTSK